MFEMITPTKKRLGYRMEGEDQYFVASLLKNSLVSFMFGWLVVLTENTICVWAGRGLGQVRSGIVLGASIMLVLWAIASGSRCRTEVTWRGGKRQTANALNFFLLCYLSRPNSPAISSPPNSDENQSSSSISHRTFNMDKKAKKNRVWP